MSASSRILAEWSPPADRRDPLALLIEQDRDRIPELLPIRYARMQASPFAFLRGAAGVMAADLGAMPASGLRLQACGDCHLANFGAFASPEGTPLFDVNDFDETLPAPFEWDLKRLATSLVLAGRVASMPERECRRLARIAARSYRRHIRRLAALSPLAAWSSRVDLAKAIAAVEPARMRRKLEKRLAVTLARASGHFGLVEPHQGGWRIREKPPLVYRLSRHELPARNAFASYADTLQEDRRLLLGRYRLHDVAFKVVGIGSVGTFCAIGLFVSAAGAPLLLQIKEAGPSVLAPFAGPSAYAVHGERVVVGQRLMQAAADVFLGWTQKPLNGRYFYVRRLKDTRLADLGEQAAGSLLFRAALTGLTLARAHARAGDAGRVSQAIGEEAGFDRAIADFAKAYADQTERDWADFKAAIAAGRIVASSPRPPSAAKHAGP